MQIEMQAIDSQMSKLVEAAERGEDVIISRGDSPAARIVPIAAVPKRFVYGILEGVLKEPIPDFEPMSNEELDQFEREKDERIARSLT